MRYLSPTRLHEMIVQDLVAEIVSGKTLPGSPLFTEVEMSNHYGVSRSVVREAVQVLVQKGLVEVRQGRGSLVNPPERWDNMDPQIMLSRLKAGNIGGILDEIMEVRRMIDVEAAGLAAERATEENINQLQWLLLQMELNLNDEEAYTEYDNQFHRRIWEAARNQILFKMAQSMAEVFGMSRHLSAVHGDLNPSLEQHREILQALEERNAERAREAMLTHIRTFEGNLRQALKRTVLANRAGAD